jgi:hypothetical protein
MNLSAMSHNGGEGRFPIETHDGKSARSSRAGAVLSNNVSWGR